ncbi:hypothetical protein EDD11_007928 [Mortierella claussenii]|nr:hypothetical protein EDD11_007928 [Mortierella claussenii]
MNLTVNISNQNTVSTHNTSPSILFSYDEDDRDHSYADYFTSGSKPFVNTVSSSTTMPTTDSTIPLTKTLTSESAKSHRSSLRAFAYRLRSRSGSRSPRNSMEDVADVFKYTHRRSSDMGGDYADVIRAQALFMDKLREYQVSNHITHNVDGLPIPPPVEREHRRSSFTRALGLDKPLLAR